MAWCDVGVCYNSRHVHHKECFGCGGRALWAFR